MSDDALATRKRRALYIARQSTLLQVAVAGESGLNLTEAALDAVVVAGRVIAMAEKLKTELEAVG